MSLHMRLGSHWMDFDETSYLSFFFLNLSRKLKFHYNPINTSTLHEGFPHVWKYLAELFLQWEMFQTKVVDKIKTHILCSVTCFRKSRAVYEIMWKNPVQPERLQTKQRMRVAFWIRKATRAQAYALARTPTHAHASTHPRARTHTHTQICNIYCFSTARTTRERASVLRSTYIDCLVFKMQSLHRSRRSAFSASVKASQTADGISAVNETLLLRYAESSLAPHRQDPDSRLTGNVVKGLFSKYFTSLCVLERVALSKWRAYEFAFHLRLSLCFNGR